MKVPSTTVRKYYKYVLEPFYINSLPTYASATEATEGKNSNAGSCLISFSPTAVYPCIAKSQNTRITNSYNYEIIFTFEHSFIFKTASHSGWVISDQLPSSGLKAIAGSNDQTTWTTLSNDSSNETAYKYIRITLTGSETHIYGQMGISYLNMAGYIYCAVPEECSEEEADFYVDTKSIKVPKIDNNLYVINDYITRKGASSIVVPITLQWTTAGTYSFTLTEEKEVTIALVGGGGGIARSWWGGQAGLPISGSGGSGGAFTGKVKLSQGTYTVTVGGGGSNFGAYGTYVNGTAGTGGSSTLSLDDTVLITATGGAGGWVSAGSMYSWGGGGAGGSATLGSVTPEEGYQLLNGNSGVAQSGGDGAGGASVYSGYGAGNGGTGFASVSWLDIVTG